MHRVATELHQALARHADVDLDEIVLRSSLRMSYVVGWSFLLKVYRQTRRLALRGEIDAVLFSSMPTASLAMPLRKTLAPLGIPIAAIAHGRDVTLRGPYQWIVRRAFEALDAVLSVSRATGVECLRRGVPREKLHVIPNGVDVKRFAPLEDAAAMRRALRERLDDPACPLPEDALLLCSVGRQVERKGFAWFVDQVMPLLSEDVHYWLAGDGSEADAIAEAARRHGLERRVRLLGRVSEKDLVTLYQGADLFVMPNIPVNGDIEGFGVVLLEAGLSGLPAIASRLEGIQDVITEGANGHLVESGDAWGFSEAIMRYYHNRPAMQAASLRAAEHTAQTFCWEAIADRHVQTLSALLPAEPETAPSAETAGAVP